MVGYAAVIWGSAGLRQWIVVFFLFCAGGVANDVQQWLLLLTAALIGFLGVPAGLLGNELAIRFGLRLTAGLIFLGSAFAGGLFGFASMLPLAAVLLLSLGAGFIVQGNFSNLTSGLLTEAAPQHAGATMALYSAVGFGGGFIGNWVFGFTLDQLGGVSNGGAWLFAFMTCGLAYIVGCTATAMLPPKSPTIASER